MAGTSAPPCPQAARAPGYEPPPLGPMGNIVTDEPVIPLANFVADALPNALVDQSRRWPYHLPSYNGVDCLWWSMLVRSMYATDSTWLLRVAGWAGPIVRSTFVDTSQPARQGYGLVELADSVLIVIPGTSSEAEALAYFLTHSLRLTTTSTVGWKINATWASRGSSVLLGYLAWPPPAPAKPVIVIGHSSGAAYGAFVTYSLYPGPTTPWTLVTFGAPIWGTDSMAARYNTLNQQPKTIDFIQPNDVVPTLPPPWAAVDILFPLQYALIDRPSYRRINTIQQLQGNNAPTQVTQPPFDGLINGLRNLITGAGIDNQHTPVSYSNAADAWAANDPTIAANRLQPAYNALKTILNEMNSAHLG
jgi:hypothetical protein